MRFSNFYVVCQVRRYEIIDICLGIFHGDAPTNNSQKTSKNPVGAGSPTIYDTHKQSHKPAPFSPLLTSTISICQFLGGGVPNQLYQNRGSRE